MATYNGGLYIRQQIESILSQLTDNDELIISDDGSTDDTIKIIESFNTPIIKLFKNGFHNYVLNFEFCLKQVSGDFIFLSDQDDVWVKDKVEIMLRYLQTYDLVCSNCYVVDKELKSLGRAFFKDNVESKPGFLKNLWKNQFLGCCLAFNRKVLESSLPFPNGLICHDTWIGLVAELCGKTKFIDDKLIYFRRHDSNTSNTLKGSDLSLLKKISYRLVIIKGTINNFLLKNNRKSSN